MAPTRQRTPTEVALIGRHTQQRSIVLAAFIRADGFVGAQALHAQLAADGTPVGLSTVYRTLTRLAGAGRADLVRDAGGERLFRYRPGPDHRHYLICTECGLSHPVELRPDRGLGGRHRTALRLRERPAHGGTLRSVPGLRRRAGGDRTTVTVEVSRSNHIKRSAQRGQPGLQGSWGRRSTPSHARHRALPSKRLRR
ncbi:transcriptional repressor [Streptomyces sp. NPDC051133]|uniref:transcriptional repressor n=1 Tax=Streptomyces sp. NPDC051133 TaxID=3155521 RepID=UPI003411FDF4